LVSPFFSGITKIEYQIFYQFKIVKIRIDSKVEKVYNRL